MYSAKQLKQVLRRIPSNAQIKLVTALRAAPTNLEQIQLQVDPTTNQWTIIFIAEATNPSPAQN